MCYLIRLPIVPFVRILQNNLDSSDKWYSFYFYLKFRAD